MIKLKKFIRNSFLTLALASLINSLDAKPIKRIDPINVGIGIVAALLINTALELGSVTMHELGHAGANKAMNPKDPINIKLGLSGNIAGPFNGTTYFKSPAKNKLLEAIRIAAGPISGISSKMLQIVLLQILENHTNKEKLITKNSVNPFGFFKTSTEYHKKTTGMYFGKKPINETYSIAEVAFGVLSFLRTSSMIGEILYGFTPMPIDKGTGDGQQLWKIILNRKNGYPAVNKKIINIIHELIMGLPFIIGTTKSLKENLK